LLVIELAVIGFPSARDSDRNRPGISAAQVLAVTDAELVTASHIPEMRQ
jgi:hypothetical protein